MNRNEILDMAKAKFGDRETLEFSVVWEHGRFWLIADDLTMDEREGQTTYSVVDTSNGIDFEEL